MWGSKAISFADIITLLFTVLAAWLYAEFGALKIKLKNEKGDSQFFPLSKNNAPTYLLLPLGKWGSKWDDFYWAMGCVYTANVLSAESTDECLRTKSKDN